MTPSLSTVIPGLTPPVRHSGLVPESKFLSLYRHSERTRNNAKRLDVDNLLIMPPYSLPTIH
jgi:hypothetical protein